MTDFDTTTLPGAPPPATAADAPATRSQTEFVNAWQTGLLPLMTKTLAGLALVFFLGSFVQLYYLYGRINDVPVADLQPAFDRLDSLRTAGLPLTSQDLIAASRWQTLATLEGLAVERRYHQANVSLLSRVWITYLGFVVGMILAIVGATFVLGKMQEPESQLAAEGSGAKVSLTTASPGLVLAVLGAGLMFTTMVTHNRIDVNDRPAYVNEWAAAPLLPTGAGASSPPQPAALPRDTSRLHDTTVIR